MKKNKIYKALGIGLVSLPLLLGMGCEQKEPKTFEVTLVAEGWDYKNKNRHHIFLELDDGSVEVLSHYGKRAEEIDRQYNVGDKITVTEPGSWDRFIWGFKNMVLE